MSIDKLFFENLGTVENDNLAHMLSELGFSNSEIKSNFIEKLYEIVKSKQKHFTHRVYNPSTRWSERVLSNDIYPS